MRVLPNTEMKVSAARRGVTGKLLLKGSHVTLICEHESDSAAVSLQSR